MVYAVVRVRGTVNINQNIKHTLRLLRLTRANHCILVNENKNYKGMLQVVKDYTTWGELNSDVLSELIVSRGNLKGNVKITEAHVKTSTSYENIKQLAEAIVEGGFNYNELPNVKPIFRLNPPKKGYGGIKRSFKNGGALGYRGSEINKLIKKML